MSTDPAREAIRQAIARCERHGMSVSTKTVLANVKVGEVSMDYAQEVVQRHYRALTPIVLKEEGYVITDTVTRERKAFTKITLAEWKEQLDIKEESATYDAVRLRADRKLAEFWAEKNKDFGYEVYPELFWEDVCRIYAMEGIQPPPLSSLNGKA